MLSNLRIFDEPVLLRQMILKELLAPAEAEVALPEPNQCLRIGWMHPCQHEEILMQQICHYWIVVWVETEVKHQVLRVFQAD